MSRYKFGNGATWHGNAAGNERAQIMSPLCVAGIAAADDGGHESFRAAIKLITHFAVWARAWRDTSIFPRHAANRKDIAGW